MNIFLTGATGFIGWALIPELLQAGHTVLGLTRSEDGAKALLEAGVKPYRGTLEDPDGLKDGAAQADGVIHCAFDHNFATYAANCEKDRRVITALGDALAGSNRPLVITSATGMGSLGGEVATEDVFNAQHPVPRVISEIAGQAQLERGVNVSVVRLPQVHDTEKAGLISPYIEMCRDNGVCSYVGDGAGRWAACHISDAVGVFRGAVERAQAGARYHAVGEEGVSFREIAEVIGRGLKLPVTSIRADQAAEQFGWLAPFFSLDMAAANTLTRDRLNWNPTGPGLLADLEAMRY